MEAAIFSEPWTKTGFLETLSETEHVFLVAEDQENLCAYGILYCNSDEGEIPTIAVSEEARGRGLGKRLLSRMMEEAEKRGVAMFIWKCERATCRHKDYTRHVDFLL